MRPPWLATPAAVALARAAATASRLARLGGGSTLPGLIARRIDPGITPRLAAQLPRGCLVVSGTNGKTTTTRLIARALQQAGWRLAANRAGANLAEGITAALVAGASLAGIPRADAGCFEVDEAALPQVVAEVRPRLVVLLNLFRDQLDRYGELDYLAQRWQCALAGLPTEAQVLLNADDPLVAALGRIRPRCTRYFGVASLALVGEPLLEHAADSWHCPRCHRPLRYSLVLYGHLGHYTCDHCGFERPSPHYSARAVHLHGLEGAAAQLAFPGGQAPIEVHLPGLYNVANAVAAASACLALGLPPEHVAASLRDSRAVFGRAERFTVGDHPTTLMLAKNPAGYNQVLRTLVATDASPRPVLLLALNDNLADGRDVSWIWDVDFERLAPAQSHVEGRTSQGDTGQGASAFDQIVVTGTRAEDLAVRLKYAGVGGGRVQVERDFRHAVQAALRAAAPGAPVYVVPTYTALFPLRRHFARLAGLPPFWED